MSEFLFGVLRGKLTPAQVKLRNTIAERHDCTFVYTSIPGTGLQSWFAGPNLGHPFDRDLAERVKRDIEAAEPC